ncbi:hydroxypyruvate isomerase, partial [Mycobacterium tuberculosis]|nr:hydroxypyruvate isomerase [Mycobacterium tuberculosis]
AGVDAVEYLCRYEVEAAVLTQKLGQHRRGEVLHNLPAGNWAGGERGIAVLPDRIDEFRRGVATAIDYATELGCRQINCLAGIA